MTCWWDCSCCDCSTVAEGAAGHYPWVDPVWHPHGTGSSAGLLGSQMELCPWCTTGRSHAGTEGIKGGSER